MRLSILINRRCPFVQRLLWVRPWNDRTKIRSLVSILADVWSGIQLAERSGSSSQFTISPDRQRIPQNSVCSNDSLVA
jgi:hypothetical protein